MTKHPLTDDICLAIDDNPSIAYMCFDWKKSMRAAADWQLDQDQKKLEDFLEEFSCLGHSADAVLYLRAFVNNFQSIMRPQENN